GSPRRPAPSLGSAPCGRRPQPPQTAPGVPGWLGSSRLLPASPQEGWHPGSVRRGSPDPAGPPTEGLPRLRPRFAGRPTEGLPRARRFVTCLSVRQIRHRLGRLSRLRGFRTRMPLDWLVPHDWLAFPVDRDAAPAAKEGRANVLGVGGGKDLV